MLTRIRRTLTPAEWARAAGLAAAVLGLHLVGFGLLFGVVVPHHLSLGPGEAFTAGIGLTAYSTLHDVTGLVGTGVSGTFLCVIGVLNLVVLVGIVRVFAEMRRGAYSEAELEELLASRGS
jgi:High-affinity nickel-transport protein